MSSMRIDHPGGVPGNQHHQGETLSPTYEHASYPRDMQQQSMAPHHGGHPPMNMMQGPHQLAHQPFVHPHMVHDAAENIWRSIDTTNEQLPVWISDQSLGGNSFQQSGMDAFFLPADYLPTAPQIW